MASFGVPFSYKRKEVTIILKFKITGQELTRSESSKVIADSQNYLYATFDFPLSYTGISTAHFSIVSDAERYGTPMTIANGKCQVPNDCIVSGGFYVCVTSLDGDVFITTDEKYIPVSASGIESGELPNLPDGEPNQYAELANIYQDIMNGAYGGSGGGITPHIDDTTKHWFIGTTDTGILAQGTNGKGIVSIAKTSTVGLVDIYTITYTDATTSTYTVKNGADGTGGSESLPDTTSVIGESPLMVNVTPTANELEWYDLYKYPPLPVWGHEYLFSWYNKLYNNSTVKICAEGDSTTYEGFWNATGKRLELFAKIMTQGNYPVASFSIVNQGFGSATSGHWVGTWTTDVLATLPNPPCSQVLYPNGTLADTMAKNPDLIIWNFGINDASTGLFPTDTITQRLTRFENNLNEGLARIRGNVSINGRPSYNKSPDALAIILCTPITTYTPTLGKTRELWTKFTRRIIQKACRTYKCAFWDISMRHYDHDFSVLWSTNTAETGTDGTHPLPAVNADMVSSIQDLLYPLCMWKPDTAVITLPTPSAPTVTADDTNNVIVGADATMEYSSNGGASWTLYSTSPIPTFTGSQTVLVRIKATTTANASANVSLVFADATIPAAPSVTADDTNDVIVGATTLMEYSVNSGTTWTVYSTSSIPTFTGAQTVLVRVAANGGVSAGNVTTLSFHAVAPTVTTTTVTTYPNVGQTVSMTTGALTTSAYVDGSTDFINAVVGDTLTLSAMYRGNLTSGTVFFYTSAGAYLASLTCGTTDAITISAGITADATNRYIYPYTYVIPANSKLATLGKIRVVNWLSDDGVTYPFYVSVAHTN